MRGCESSIDTRRAGHLLHSNRIQGDSIVSTALNLPRKTQPTFAGWLLDNRTLVVGHALWAIALICIATLGEVNADVGSGRYNVSTVQAGLL